MNGDELELEDIKIEKLVQMIIDLTINSDKIYNKPGFKPKRVKVLSKNFKAFKKLLPDSFTMKCILM